MSDRKPSLIDLLGQYMRDAAPGGVLNPEVTGQGLLDAAALTTAPVPVAGDLVGLLADANRMRDPKERTALNYGLMALGALPFVPSGLRQAKKAIGKADDAKRAKTSFEIAHEVAQRNAALPVSQGGLGLPPNNTAMDRARAMGFDTDVYHATRSDFSEFKPSSYRGASFFAQTPQGAMAGASAGIGDGTASIAAGPRILPTKIRSADIEGLAFTPKENLVLGSIPDVVDEATVDDIAKKLGKPWYSFFKEVENPDGTFYYVKRGNAKYAEAVKANRDVYGSQLPLYADATSEKWASEKALKNKMGGFMQWDEGGASIGMADPSRIRSRFAAFDPKKRDSSDILASLAPYLITGGLAGLLGLPSDE